MSLSETFSVESETPADLSRELLERREEALNAQISIAKLESENRMERTNLESELSG